MRPTHSKPVVHLELHTGALQEASSFYEEVCGWRTEHLECRNGSYNALELGGGLGGGIVECPTPRTMWLPYVGVTKIDRATDRARDFGAAVLLEPREGPAGWRSVVATQAGGEIAFWQQKR